MLEYVCVCAQQGWAVDDDHDRVHQGVLIIIGVQCGYPLYVACPQGLIAAATGAGLTLVFRRSTDVSSAVRDDVLLRCDKQD